MKIDIVELIVKVISTGKLTVTINDMDFIPNQEVEVEAKLKSTYLEVRVKLKVDFELGVGGIYIDENGFSYMAESKDHLILCEHKAWPTEYKDPKELKAIIIKHKEGS